LAECDEIDCKIDCEIIYDSEIFHGIICKSKFGSANIFANGKIVILTRKEEYIVPIIKNIEKAVYLTKSAIPL